MKIIYTLTVAFLLIANVFAQSPQKISYQAVIRGIDNSLIINQGVGMRISILQNSPFGTEVYKETYSTNPQTNGNGLVTLAIGTGTPVTGVFANITWGTGAYFIKVEIDPTGGTNYTITSTSQFLSVPYAFYAKTAGNGFSGSYTDLTNRPKGNAVGDMQYWDGTAWVMVPAGKAGQYLQLAANNTPAWTGNSFPVITSSAASSITWTSAVVGGNVTDEGGVSVTDRGICWSATANPTIANNKISSGTGAGSFSVSLTGLTAGETYYVRAFATNSMGTAYGKEITLVTLHGNVSYSLAKAASPTAEQLNAYNLITLAMDSAIWYYNRYTTYTKVLYVSYVPGVPTADGSNSGSIRFGSNTSYMQKATAMHEIMHTVGVGQNGSWFSTLMVGGIYQGANANAVLQSITGVATDKIHGDAAHFWPYGLNYESEYKSTADLINHCRIMEAMKQDGL